MTAGRLLRIGVVIAGIWLALLVIGYWVFESGGSTPGDGKGDIIQPLTTP